MALVVAAATFALSAAAAQAAVRTYYIASDEVVWNYAPSGIDMISGGPLPPLAPDQLGHTYRKVVYREYSDATFKSPVPQPAYMGLLGPTMHAQVGDTIVVYFKNHARIPTNMALAGAAPDHTAAVRPYGTARYEWHITDANGPGNGDRSSIAWRYFSTVDETDDENAGLMGVLVVTKRGLAKADGAPTDVDDEVFTAFSEMDESLSRMVDINVADPTLNLRHVKKGPPFTEFTFDNQYYTINGFVFGNMPIPAVRVGARVRWYIPVTESDFDAHMPHWHGNTALAHGMRTDIIDAQMNQVQVVDMMPDNPGIWLFHCHVALHLAGGMEARYAVVK